MENLKNAEVVLIDDLPFEVKKDDDHLIFSAKPKKNLNKHQRKEFFKKNSTVVKLVLFDDAYFDRINKIHATFEINKSLLSRIKEFPRNLYAALTEIMTKV